MKNSILKGQLSEVFLWLTELKIERSQKLRRAATIKRNNTENLNILKKEKNLFL